MDLRRMKRVPNVVGGFEDDDDDDDDDVDKETEDKEAEGYSENTHFFLKSKDKQNIRNCILCATRFRMFHQMLTFVDLQRFTDNPSYFFVLQK
jgi:hypothetical protein